MHEFIVVSGCDNNKYRILLAALSGWPFLSLKTPSNLTDVIGSGGMSVIPADENKI